MAASTIEKNIRRTFIGVIAAIFGIMLVTVLVVNEQLEKAMLELELQSERELVLDRISDGSEFTLDTQAVKAYFSPDGVVRTMDVPLIFRGLPVPFSGEIETQQQTHLISTERLNNGVFYIAKDISLFERREEQFLYFLLLIGAGVMVLGVVAARISSARLVKPIRTLTGEIRNIVPSARMPTVKQDFKAAELAEIASSFNLFLKELESYIRREQSLMGLVSHELRTPVAVMSGALDILEQRDDMSAPDKRTLLRVRHAVDEMASNIDTILKLTRRKSFADRRVEVRLAELVHEVSADLAGNSPDAGRMVVDIEAEVVLHADPSLVRMLLRNLMQNALQHTKGKVTVRLMARSLHIQDQGDGMPSDYVSYLNGGEASSARLPALSGLGLLIVTLICERLEWNLQVQSHPSGATIEVVFAPGSFGK